MRAYFGIVAAGPFFFVSAWLLMLFAGGFALDVGIVPLTGTTDTRHMREDLDVFTFRLERNEVEFIENLAHQR